MDNVQYRIIVIEGVNIQTGPRRVPARTDDDRLWAGMCVPNRVQGVVASGASRFRILMPPRSDFAQIGVRENSADELRLI